MTCTAKPARSSPATRRRAAPTSPPPPPPPPRRSRPSARPRPEQRGGFLDAVADEIEADRRRSSRPRWPRATCPRPGSPVRSAAPPASCGCSPTSCAAATTSASASTPPCRTARRCPAPTSASARSRSARSRSSAPATSRSPSPPPAATPPRRWPPAARSSSRPTPPTRAPATSSARAVTRAVAQSRTAPPARSRSCLRRSGVELGQELVSDPRIKAVGFTGSRGGGLALVAAAAARPEPIPVYAEMSSINPVVVLPGALADGDVRRAGDGVRRSLTLGAGQFCTNPGLLFLPDWRRR